MKQHPRIVARSRLHHDPHFACVANVRQWIAVDHHEIGELSRLERAKLVGDTECARAIDGGDLERRGSRDAGVCS